MSFPAEPRIEWGDLRWGRTASWEEIDAAASRWLGRPCLGVPSVRVGLLWALEFAGLRRHTSHVLVPRFVGRCILNSVGRTALPVETPTAETQAAIVVDQYGLRQDLRMLAPEFHARGWAYVEDSPYGVGQDEAPGPGSLGRFIGLSKVLPVALGGLFLTDRDNLAAFVRQKRRERSAWGALAWTIMAVLRSRRQTGGLSTLAELAYELYPAARGGPGWLRGNVARGLEQIDFFERETQTRLAAVSAVLGGQALMPDLRRLGYVVPYPVASRGEWAQAVFRRHGFDDGVFHVDTAANMLAPRFERSLLIPVNPRVPRQRFDSLVEELRTA